MGDETCLVTPILPNSFLCVKQNLEMHTVLEQSLLNYPFKAQYVVNATMLFKYKSMKALLQLALRM